MSTIGKIESLWRYPVKSMAGEQLTEAFLGFSGIYGDRIFAFRSSTARKGLPYLTARDQKEMLCYRPRFRQPESAARPTNLADAEKLPPGATPIYASAAALAVDVVTPDGRSVAIDDPGLCEMLSAGLADSPELSLLFSERALTDCRPVSLFAIQTAQHLSAQLGRTVDKRRFRANIYVNFNAAGGFGEDAYLGRSIRLGAKVVVSILERDPRCKLITLDPDGGEADLEVLRRVAQENKGMAGVYAAVLVEGTLRPGDAVELLD